MTPAFLVDGDMEQRIVQKLCPGVKVQTINCNGKNVSADKLASRIGTLLRLIRGKNSPVIILIDREGRNEDCPAIYKAVMRALQSEDVDCSSVRLHVADRMIENWILGDPAILPTKMKKNLSIVGSNGKAILKGLFRSKDSIYRETTVGVDLFLKMNYSTARANNSNFKQFSDMVGDVCVAINR